MRKFLVRVAVVCPLVVVVASPLLAQIQGASVNTGSMNNAREAGAQVTLGGGKALAAGGTNGTSVTRVSRNLYSIYGRLDRHWLDGHSARVVRGRGVE